jgi:sulfotransferase
MSSQYHFITGLPRSGTTLLSTILNQNPKFQASISGPLARFTRAIIEQSSAQGGYRYQCDESKRSTIIRSIFNAYYNQPIFNQVKRTFFDTNRGWSLLSPLVKELFPDSKIIVCVRDINWVLDSFEQLYAKNPLSISSMIPPEHNINVYTRCQYLMNDSSPVGFAYNGVKQVLCSNEKSSLFILDYEQLAKNPEQTMKALYNFIGEEYFEHDFNDVASSYDEFDEDVNLKGLHTTRKVVSFIERESILPLDITQHYQHVNVWK